MTIALRPGSRRSLTQWYLLISGLFVVLWGATGFFFNRSFAIGTAALHDPANHALAFGVFETNGWHNVAALILGALALALSGARTARATAAVLGAGYLVVTVQMAVVEPFLIAGNLADNVVHLVLGVTGLAAAAMQRSRPVEQSTIAS